MESTDRVTGLHLILRAVDLQRTHSISNFGVILLKPDFTSDTEARLSDHCERHSLSLIWDARFQLTAPAVIMLYPATFRFSEDDLRYGILWKKQLIDYLSTGVCKIFVFEGNSATEKLAEFKHKERGYLGKLSKPENNMDQTEFIEKVVKNAVHVVEKVDIENALWLLACCVSQ